MPGLIDGITARNRNRYGGLFQGAGDDEEERRKKELLLRLMRGGLPLPGAGQAPAPQPVGQAPELDRIRQIVEAMKTGQAQTEQGGLQRATRRGMADTSQQSIVNDRMRQAMGQQSGQAQAQQGGLERAMRRWGL